MFIANDHPDIMLITEIIPKNQVNPITQALLDIEGYKSFLNVNPNNSKLGGIWYPWCCHLLQRVMVVSEVNRFQLMGAGIMRG